jgi:2-polyprenyl-6-methoxyphenol hydroxylase-like FAD-dependent oxidoreductase
MNAGILDSISLAGALRQALAGNEASLDSYGSARRPVAQQVIALADRLTRMATARPGLRAARNLLLRTLSRLPMVRRQLAWRLSGLVYRP